MTPNDNLDDARQQALLAFITALEWLDWCEDTGRPEDDEPIDPAEDYQIDAQGEW